MALLPLPSEVVSRIRSGVSMVNPSQCLAELIFNSIDAGATNIVTHLDLSCHKMQVIDNGMGMTPVQLKLVGERYCTSKCHSVNDLSDLQCFGYRGEALASLREISGMMEIISKASSCKETYCKLFVQGKAREITKSSANKEQNGTTITILDFMYNLPVRKKLISETLDLEHCRSHLARIALIHPHISFILYNDITDEIILQTHKSKSILASFVTLFGQKKAEHLKAVCYSLLPYRMTGYIGLESHASKDLQFLYVNNHIVLKTKLHKIINSLLKKYLLVCHRIPKESYSFNSPNKSSAVTYQDRHAVFVLNICCPSNSYDLCLEPKKSLIEFKEWIKVLNLIEKCICCFLKDNNIAVEEESEICNNDLFCPLTGKLIHSNNQGINTYDTKNALFSLIAKRDVADDITENKLSSQQIMEEDQTEEVIPNVDNFEKIGIQCINQEDSRQKITPHHVMSRFILGTSRDSNPLIKKNVVSDHVHHNKFSNNKITNALIAFKRKASTKEVVFTKIQPKEKVKFITVGKKVIRLPTVMKPCHSKNALHQLKSTKNNRFVKLKKSCESMRNRKIQHKSCSRETLNTQVFNGSFNLFENSDYKTDYFGVTSSKTSSLKCDFHHKKNLAFENYTKLSKIQEKEQNKILQNSLMDKSQKTTSIFSSLEKSHDILMKTCKEINHSHINCTNIKEIPNKNMNSTIQPFQNFNIEFSLDKEIEKEFQLFTSEKCDDKSNLLSASKLKFEIENILDNQHDGITKVTRSLTTTDTITSMCKDNIKCKVDNISVLNFSELSEKLHVSDVLTPKLLNNTMTKEIKPSENDKKLTINCTTNYCESNILDSNKNCILPSSNDEDVVTTNSSRKLNFMDIKFSSISNEDRLKGKLWICHKDLLSGKCIYLNSNNANSAYTCPEIETAAMDINANISENHIRSHFFLSHNSTPFLPRPSLQRNTIWTKLKNRALLQTDDELSNSSSCMQLISLTTNKAGTNISGMFQNWKNPVFQKQDFKEITTINLKQIAKREVKIYNLTQPHNMSKTELENAKVMGQVDSKFIACLVPKYEKNLKAHDFIVIFDQHAVHERIRLEQLIQDLYEEDNGIQRMKLSFLEPAVNVKLRPEELRIIKAYNNELNKLGFSLHINDQNVTTVSSVPSCLLEKEANERKRGKWSITAIIIENILKEWVQMLQETGVTSTLPKTLLSVLNSQACHGAIKFGDPLEKAECSKLIKMLTLCKLPFQCAHGRPSLVPIVDLSSFSQPETKTERPQLWKLSKR